MSPSVPIRWLSRRPHHCSSTSSGPPSLDFLSPTVIYLPSSPGSWLLLERQHGIARRSSCSVDSKKLPFGYSTPSGQGLDDLYLISDSVRSRSQDKDFSISNFTWEVSLGMNHCEGNRKVGQEGFLTKLVIPGIHWSLMPPTGTSRIWCRTNT